MSIDVLNNFVEQWAISLEQTKKCPYAKAALDKNKIKTVMSSCESSYDFWSTVFSEAEQFDDSNDVVIIAMQTDTEIITKMQFSGGCDSFNGMCRSKNIDLWALNLYEEMYTMVLLQRLSKLDYASKVFESKNYYANYVPYMYNKFINTRRKIREELNG
jgi:hypothetical protein